LKFGRCFRKWSIFPKKKKSKLTIDSQLQQQQVHINNIITMMDKQQQLNQSLQSQQQDNNNKFNQIMSALSHLSLVQTASKSSPPSTIDNNDTLKHKKTKQSNHNPTSTTITNTLLNSPSSIIQPQ